MSNFFDRFSLSGKKSLVTGASKGIGEVIAKVLAEAGSDLVIVGRDKDGLNKTQQFIKKLGRDCLIINSDLSQKEGPEKVARKALDYYGTIDVLINNAGVTLLDSVLSTDIEDWEKVLATNLSAPFMIAKNLAPKMIEQRSGKIVNISSLASEYALENHIAYSVSKSGLNMMTKAMTAEWTRYNIQVNSVCPTVVMTSMGELAWGDPEKSAPMLAKIPLGRFGQPSEIADLVLFLSSNASDFICGQSIFIDGGFSVM